MNRKTNTALIALLGTVLMSLSTWALMEIIELREKDHPFYLGCQYHPEFKTVVGKPSPPFYGFILASSGQYKGVGKPLPSNDQFRDLLASPKAITKRNAESSALSSSDSSAKRARRS